jgi:hypothetical protein
MDGASNTPPLAFFARNVGERDRRGRHEIELREALLPEAVIQAPLERPDLTLRHAIRGPGCVGALGVRGLGEVGQVLQADPLAVRAVTARTGEVVRPAAEVEDLLADLVRFLLLGVVDGDVHLHSARLAGHVRDERVHGHFLAGIAERILLRLGRSEALQVHHAGDEARLEVLDLVRVGEVLGQHRVRALDDARPEAQVALLERGGLRAALLLPEVLTAGFPQFGGVAVDEGGAIALDLLDGRSGLLGVRGDSRPRAHSAAVIRMVRFTGTPPVLFWLRCYGFRYA